VCYNDGMSNPWDRLNHSNRFREDDWHATKGIAEEADLSHTALIAHGMEVMQGFLRCDRGNCYTSGPPVPVTFGDLAGKTPGEWIAEAAKQVRRQHPRHHPVTIGAQPAAHVIPATPEPLPRARTRPGAAVFMEPGSQPVITTVPEVPDRKKERAGR
jgi:hypothetical protein